MAKETKEEKAARIAGHRWVKGQASPNPGGRPKGPTLSRELREALSQVDPKDKEGRTFLQTIARKLVETAAMGSIKATAEILDRLEGKPIQPTAAVSMDSAQRQERVETILEKLAALKENDDHSRVN